MNSILAFRLCLICLGLTSRDNKALSKALADLSNQVLDLKYALKEVSNERDTLKRLRARREQKNTTRSSPRPVSYHPVVPRSIVS